MIVEAVSNSAPRLPAGTPVTCASRPPPRPAAVADHPNVWDRRGRTPNSHLAFGTGGIQSAGIMALARGLGGPPSQISRLVLARFPELSMKGEPGARRAPHAYGSGFLERPCRGRWITNSLS